VTDAGGAAGFIGDVAVASGPAGAARGRCLDGRAESRIHEIGYASPWPVLVVARIAGILLAGEHFSVDLAAGLLQQAERDRREDDPWPEGSAGAPFLRHVAPLANAAPFRCAFLRKCATMSSAI